MTASVAIPQYESANHRIFRAATSVIAAGLAVKIAATLKEFTVAGVYGRSDAMDAFLVAFLVPNLLINLIAESMNQALVPTLIRVRIHQGHACAQKLLSSSMLWMCAMLTAVSLAMALLARVFFPLIGSNFDANKLGLALRLFYALLPVVVVSGIASNCTAVLNMFDSFALPALAPLVTPLSILAGALLLHGRFGIWALVYATMFGALVHAGLVAWMMDTHGFRFRLHWYGATEPAREVARQYGPVLLSSVVASGGLLVDQAMAAMLPAGSVSALVFGNRFVSVIVTLLAGAVSSAVVPHFSAMIAHSDWKRCRDTLRTWARLTALASVPIAGLLIVSARPLVRITLQHGAFGPNDTKVVTSVLAMYAIQVPFFVVSRVFYRFIVAMRRTDLVLYCGVLNLVLDIGLNFILMRYMGVAGIALATSLWSISTLMFLWYWSRRLLTRECAKAT
jgi:putative peptidoglycan lipid II flippase